MTSLVPLLNIVFIIASIVLMVSGHVRGNDLMLIVGAVCVTASSIVLLAFMCIGDKNGSWE